ncbi:MAG TPA: prepilin-type N-terminal cleavage/methylation domain-containing protein [bacterium]|nr:prepilin-type N-terminal cleavage/methylation domain-containing protein [bacterium]
MKNTKKGFTLIELLVVIAIIGLLSTLAVVALNNARAKARDARRVSDVKQIQTALELYAQDANGYPTNLPSIGSAMVFSGNTYMGQRPGNPSPNGCDYSYSGGGSTYAITFCLESNVGGLSTASTIHTANQNGIQ